MREDNDESREWGSAAQLTLTCPSSWGTGMLSINKSGILEFGTNS